MLANSDTTHSSAPIIPEPPTVYLVRVYANGSAKHSLRRGDQSDWISYNTRWRPGNALFVDGVCVNAGSLTPTEIALVSRKIKEEMANGSLSELKIDKIENNVEFFGGRLIHEYSGYRPEAHREAFVIK